MPTSVAVIFDNPVAVYFSGQTITGRVQVVCDKPKTCRGIEVEFSGYGKVHWTERKQVRTGDDRQTETRHYTSRESYYNMKYYVWGNGSSTSELPPGTHVFNFIFLLPQGIPSSFESHIGKVRHHCKAKMDIPWKIDKTCLRPYSVNALYDLNMDAQSMMKIECNKHDYMCCFWCKSGPLSLVLCIDRSGYVPGEHIVINAEVSNMTKVKVKYTKAQIYQTIVYYAEGKRKREYRKVAELRHPETAAGGDDIWSNVELLVPALPPSHLQFCNIIDIAYDFKFEVEPSGCHSDLEHEVPIIIGSIPLKQYFGIFANVGPPMHPGMLPQPGFSAPGVPPAPGFITPGFPDGQPSAPAYPGYPAPGIPNPNMSPYNPNMPPPAYSPPVPSAPIFPGAQQYPGMPMPGFNPCMFGVANFTEGDSDDEGHGDNGTKFAPHYVSYSLVNSKYQMSGCFPQKEKAGEKQNLPS